MMQAKHKNMFLGSQTKQTTTQVKVPRQIKWARHLVGKDLLQARLALIRGM